MNFKSLYTIVFAFLCCFSAINLNAQTPLDEAVRRADITPTWPNCDPIVPDCTKSRLDDFIEANLQLPAEAKAENAGGLVMMEFVVEKNGSIGEVKPVVDPGLGLGAEATRVINLMKTKKIKWSAAKVDGKRVPYRYTVPISFNLSTAPKASSTTTSSISFKADPNKVYDILEDMPQYAKCADSDDASACTYAKIIEHINANLDYPQEAIDNKVEGQAIVEFVVDINGAITNPKIVKGLGSGCDKEVLRVVMLMPAWTPGTIEGTPVKVKKTLPVLFKLPKEEMKEE